MHFFQLFFKADSIIQKMLFFISARREEGVRGKCSEWGLWGRYWRQKKEIWTMYD